MEWVTIRIFLEAYFNLAKARLLKQKSFGKTAPTIGEPMKETSYETTVIQKKYGSKISQAIHIMSRYTFWESECLVKAIAAMKMLERRGIESTLYLGTARDDNGKMIAHAWLRSGPYYITGAEGMERFTVVHTFAKRVPHKKRDNHGEQSFATINKHTQ